MSEQNPVIRQIRELKKVLEDSSQEFLSHLRLLKQIEQYILGPWEEFVNASQTTTNTINIALVGKFSSGKSSFINSLINQAIAPATTKPTTRSITTFRYGKFLKYYDVQGNTFLSEEEYFAAAQNNHNEYVIYLPCEALKDFSIIDTPGFNPPTTENVDSRSDAEMSERAVESADILFYLTNITKGSLGEDGLDYLKKSLQQHTPDVYIILNHVDLRAKQVDRDAVKKSIQEECQREGILIKGILEYSSLWDGNKPGWENRRIEGTTLPSLRNEMFSLLKKLSQRKGEFLERHHLAKQHSIFTTVSSIFKGKLYKDARNDCDMALKKCKQVYQTYRIETQIDDDTLDDIINRMNSLYKNHFLYSWMKRKKIKIDVGFIFKNEKDYVDLRDVEDPADAMKINQHTKEVFYPLFQEYGIENYSDQLIQSYSDFVCEGLKEKISYVNERDGEDHFLETWSLKDCFKPHRCLPYPAFSNSIHSFFRYKSYHNNERYHCLLMKLDSVLIEVSDNAVEFKEREQQLTLLSQQLKTLKWRTLITLKKFSI